MTAYDGSLGYLIQGVSQQPRAVQPEGHVQASTNMRPSVTEGLVTRAGTRRLNNYVDVDANAKWSTVICGATVLHVSIGPLGGVRLFDLSGDEWTVTGEGPFADYLAGADYAYGTEKFVYVLNQQVVVAATDSPPAMLNNWAYAYSLGGAFNRTYTLRLRYNSDGTVVLVTYTCPDGTSPGDANKSTGVYIMNQLRLAMLAHPNYKGTTTAINFREYLSLTDPTESFELLVEDGNNNLTLRGGSAEAGSFDDVPKYAPHGAVIRVFGEPGSRADDVWLRFNIPGAVLGGSFGRSGTWKECADPAHTLEFDLSTMPHRITLNFADKEAVVSRGTWGGRRCGDEQSSPAPSFIGRKIRDIGEFAGRLYMLAGKTCCASCVGENGRDPTSFFRETAVDILRTDAIDLRAPGDGGNLRYAVPYDKNLVVFSDDAQYVLEGGSGFGPETAALSLVTGHSSTDVRPVLAGNLVMFPFARGRNYIGVQEYRPAVTSLDTYINDTTQVVPKYVPSEVNTLVSSDNASCLLAYQRNGRIFYVHDFKWQGREKVQSAWHAWTMPNDIRHAYIDGGMVYIMLAEDGYGGMRQVRMDLTRSEDFLPYGAYLDDYGYVTTTDAEYTHASPNIRFIAVTSDAEETTGYARGQEVRPLSVEEYGSAFRYTFGDDAPVEMIGGYNINGSVVLPKPVVKDWRGNVDHRATIVVEKYDVEYEEFGAMSMSVRHRLRKTPSEAVVHENHAIRFDNDPTYIEAYATKSGVFVCPWGYPSEYVDAVWRTTSAYPVTLEQVRWSGVFFKKEL